jgi:hypothetical protein
MHSNAAARRETVEKALLAYRRSPGQFATARRQPPILFAGIPDVLQFAAGRAPGGPEAPEPSAQVRQAACFFVRSALLPPEVGHYELLGLEPNATPDAVKERYRLMMRLLHPDFSAAAPGVQWPADAATRVNLAYEVLSSPVQRRAYDERIATPTEAPLRAAPPAARPVAERTPSRRTHEDSRRDLKRLSAVFGAVGGVALVAAGVASMQSQNKEDLVQRAQSQSGAAAVIAAVTPPAPVAPPLAPALPAMPAQLPLPRYESPPETKAAAVSARPTSIVMAAPPSAEPPRVAPVVLPTPASVSVPPPDPAPAPALQAAALTVPVALPAPVQIPAPPAAAPLPPRAAPYSGPSMADVHPLLARLLQEIESGSGERMLRLVDREARSAPAAQALVAQYNGLVEGARSVKVSNVQFNAQPREGRLLVVTGRLLMQPAGGALPPREFAMQAEFASRDGTVVITRLVRAPD